MSTDRIHRTVSADGTGIAGRVRGDGPPVVFVSSALGDERTSWAGIVPLLSDRFTCCVMSTRGRGSSDDNPDHSRARLLEDIVAFVDSIGAPVGLVGHSSAGALALEAAAGCPEVRAVAVHEPTLLEFAGDDAAASIVAGLRRVRSLAEADRLVDAAMAFFTDAVACSEDELEELLRVGAPKRAAGYVPLLLDEAAQSPPGLSDLEVLDRVTVPVLVLTGSRTRDLWHDVSRELARRLAHPVIREVEGVAHFAPVLSPDSLAGDLARFFRAELQPLQPAR